MKASGKSSPIRWSRWKSRTALMPARRAVHAKSRGRSSLSEARDLSASEAGKTCLIATVQMKLVLGFQSERAADGVRTSVPRTPEQARIDPAGDEREIEDRALNVGVRYRLEGAKELTGFRFRRCC